MQPNKTINQASSYKHWGHVERGADVVVILQHLKECALPNFIADQADVLSGLKRVITKMC